MSQVVVPDIGDFKEVEVIEVLVKPGDAVSKEQSLITLESDKATMEIPSPAAGVVKAIKVKTGDKVSQGSPILELDAKDEPKKADVKKEEPKKQEPPRQTQAQPAPAAAARSGAGVQTVTVPDIGDFKEVEVIEVLVKPGDKIAKEQSLVTLESDKATMEIPSPTAGTVKEIRIKTGDKVSQGSVILVLEGTEQRAEPRSEPKAEAPKAAPSAPAPKAAPAAAPRPAEPRDESAAKPHASPSVRKFARELGVDLAQVQGSGPKGRILHADVQAFVKAALAGGAARAAPVAKGGGALPFNLPPWPEV